MMFVSFDNFTIELTELLKVFFLSLTCKFLLFLHLMCAVNISIKIGISFLFKIIIL